MSLISKNHLSLTLQSIQRLLSGKADKSEVESSISDAVSQKSQVQIITWEDDD